MNDIIWTEAGPKLVDGRLTSGGVVAFTARCQSPGLTWEVTDLRLPAALPGPYRHAKFEWLDRCQSWAVSQLKEFPTIDWAHNERGEYVGKAGSGRVLRFKVGQAKDARYEVADLFMGAGEEGFRTLAEALLWAYRWYKANPQPKIVPAMRVVESAPDTPEVTPMPPEPKPTPPSMYANGWGLLEDADPAHAAACELKNAEYEWQVQWGKLFYRLNHLVTEKYAKAQVVVAPDTANRKWVVVFAEPNWEAVIYNSLPSAVRAANKWAEGK